MVGENIKRFFGDRKPIFGQSQYDTPTIEQMRRTKLDFWKWSGLISDTTYDPYGSGVKNMAVRMADEWANSIAERYAPPDLRQRIKEYVYPQGLEIAERWLRSAMR